MFESLKLSELPIKRCGVLREPSSTRPKVWVIEEDGIRAVVKDFSVNRFFFRSTIGRFLIWREGRAYGRLKGIDGIPTFYRVIDGLALVMEEVQGRDVEGLEKEEKLPGSFFQELRKLLGKVHLRGIAHCDLKRAPNIMIGSDKKPYIVDWSAAISKRELRFFPLNLIYRRFLLDDYNAIIKVQLRHCPESITEMDKKRYYYRSKPEKIIRAIRDRVRELIQKIA